MTVKIKDTLIYYDGLQFGTGYDDDDGKDYLFLFVEDPDVFTLLSISPQKLKDYTSEENLYANMRSLYTDSREIGSVLYKAILDGDEFHIEASIDEIPEKWLPDA